MTFNAQLGLGCWSFGGKGSARPDDELSERLLEQAVEAGVSHFDTAQDYGDGHSEEVIGRFLRRHPGAGRVATKAKYCDDAAETVRLVESSLRRLGTEAIDLFVIHWPESGRNPARMVEALEICRQRGLIRRVGVSNFSVAQLQAARQAGTIDDHQFGYGLAWRRPEADVLPFCQREGIDVTVYSPLAQGLLTDRGLDRSRWAPDDPRAKTVFYRPEAWPAVERWVGAMQNEAHAGGRSLENWALRWVLGRPGVTRVLVGASTPEQLAHHVEAWAAGPDRAIQALEPLSDALAADLPPAGNMFEYYP
jgi:aryl-alcohol dehydrogenase-like predicted oxidoreductase